MKNRVITKKDFPKFVGRLTNQAEVYAPVQVKDKDYSRFGRIKSAEEICFSHLNTKLPVKELFFPQREVLFEFKPGEHSQAQPPPEIENRIALGVKPCDAAALEMFDRVFLDKEYPDPYYKERRDKTTLIGIACNQPGKACFCTAVNGNPHGTRGLDLLLIDLEDRYLAMPVSEKGEKLVTSYPEAAGKDLENQQELASKATKAIELSLNPKELKNLLDANFDHAVWQELSLPCVNCGVCTYLCPTCHCFDVTDEEYKGEGARIRTWDSCQFSMFTRHASGHNPRPTGKERMRNRTLHKFCYFPKTHEEVLCVGCGRCITECPAGIDLRETLQTLLQTLAPGKES